MKIALEPYVIDFLLYRGYKYFLSRTLTCSNEATAPILKPCFIRPDEDEDSGQYIEITKRDYVVINDGRQEWMWASIPSFEIVNLRRWQVSHYTSGLILN